MKYLIFILLLFISCEKPIENTCKECTFVEDNQTITVFVCGEELQKYERDNIKCIIPDKKWKN